MEFFNIEMDSELMARTVERLESLEHCAFQLRGFVLGAKAKGILKKHNPLSGLQQTKPSPF